MNKKIECKIVQNLLPMYIDKLTSKDVNEFIEEHLRECNDCLENMKDMGQDIKIKKIEQKKEIDTLKKYRKMQKIKILFIIIIVVIICLGIYSFHINYHIRINEEGKLEIVKSIADYGTSDLSFIIYEGTNKNREGGYTTILLAVRNDEVISARIVEKDYNNLREEYNNIIKSQLQLYSYVQFENNTLTYNDNYLTGKDVEFVNKTLNKKYNIESERKI